MYLQVKDVKKSYGEGGSYMEVLKGVSVSVDRGDMCVIQGTSGSGKSTLLNCIGGLDIMHSGSIKVDGKEIFGLSQDELSKLLLCDEPTGALNRASTEEIMEEFVRLNQDGVSALIVTHDSKVAGYCDRLLYMVDGKISGECVLGKYEASQKHNREITVNNWLEKHGW